MRQFPVPEYTLLQRLRRDVLGGVTQRVAIATALRVTAEVLREGGADRVKRHCFEFRGAAPSETPELLPMEAVLRAQTTPMREPEPVSPPPAETRHERVVHMAGR
jgi:hypothetical protein